MKSKKILIIIIIMILVLAVAGTVLGYLYMETDTFKSDKELFSKYIYQNIEMLNKYSDSQILKQYSGLKDEEKYESETNLKTTYSEGGEVSSSLNNLSATINVQKDAADKYFYADGQVLFGEQKYLESEIIKDQELYGIRFTDVVKQFLTVKDDQNLDSVAKDMGTDSVTLEKIMNVIDGTGNITETVISDSDKQALKDKYSKLITDAVSEGQFGSNKKAMITYNNNTINTKAYTVSLSSEQVEKLIVEILNNLKNEDVIINNANTQKEKYQDEIDKEINSLTEEKDIPAVKITVYEQSGNTIRTVLEIGNNKIVIESTESNGELKTKAQLTVMNSDKTNEYGLELTKNTNSNKENINCIVNVDNGDEQYTVSLLNDMQYTDSSLQLKSSINYKKDILTASISLENNTTLNGEFDKKQTLSEENNFVLNDSNEELRKNIINQLKEKVPEKVESRISLLKEALGLGAVEEKDEIVPEAEMTQVDINKFNAKFEFYTGDEVTAENVKTLLGIVKDNLGSYEITPVDDEQNNQETDPSRIRYNFRLNIERNKTNQDGVNEMLGKVGDDQKYKVSIFYKEQNKLIDYITIENVTQ